MNGPTSYLLFLTMQCILLNGSKRVMKMIYTPYGPQMCTRLCEDVNGSLIYTKEDLSCRHLLVNDSRIAKSHSVHDSLSSKNNSIEDSNNSKNNSIEDTHNSKDHSVKNSLNSKTNSIEDSLSLKNRSTEDSLNSKNHSTGDSLHSKDHSTENSLNSKNHSTEDSLNSKNRSTGDFLNSKNNSTGHSLNSKNHSTVDSLNSKNHSTGDFLNSKNHSMGDSLNSKNHSTEESLNSKNHSTEDSLNSKNHSTDDSLNSKNRSTEDSLNSKNHSTEDSLNSKNHSTEDSLKSLKQEAMTNDSASPQGLHVQEICEAHSRGESPYSLPQNETNGNVSAGSQEVSHCKNLHKACRKGMLCKAILILSRRLADINCRGQLDRTPVMVAAGYKQVPVFDFLLSQGCDLGAMDGYNYTVLHVACIGGNTEIIKKLLELNIHKIDGRGSYLWTPVMLAAFFGHWEAFDLLVSEDCNLSLVDIFHCNILHIACQGGNVDVVMYIVSRQLYSIDSRGRDGMTPVMFAAERGHTQVYAYLGNKGCDLEAVDELKRNVLHAACGGGHVDMVKYIISQKLHDIESRAYKGRTPVMFAAEHGHVAVLDFLAGKGCYLTTLDNDLNNILHLTCVGGHIDMVNHILSHNIFHMDSRGSNGRTPLMVAAEFGQQAVVDLLTRKGCNLKALDRQGNNVLHIACYGGHVNIVTYILSRGKIDVDCRGNTGRTPVMVAAKFGHQGVFDLLISKGCHLRYRDYQKNNILHAACLGGQTHIVEYLLSKDVAKINSRGLMGRTPVMLATWKGHKEVVKLLVRRRCDLRTLDQQKNNILHVASIGGHVDMVRYILSQHIVLVDSAGYEGRTSLLFAAWHGHMAVVELLVSEGCNYRVTDDDKYNILHLASMVGHVDVAKYILSHNLADINSKGFAEMTPAMIAAQLARKDVLKILVRAGCSLTAVNIQKNNVLHVACFGGNVDVVKYILSQKRINIESRGTAGRRPVMLAAEGGHRGVVELLLRKGCNILAYDDQRNTVLHTACIGGHVPMVKYILSLHRIRSDSRGHFGRTPVLLAAENGRREVVDLLKSKGCDLQALDNDRNNILHLACFGGHVDMVRYLLTLRVVDVKARNMYDKTPMEIAKSSGHPAVVALFDAGIYY